MKHVVLVEDNPSVAAYFAYVLRALGGYVVDAALRGEEVLALARQPGTTAVVLDVTLRATQYLGRHVDGVELCRILKANPDTARVPVVLASGHVMPGDRERLLALSGADVFLPKPLTHHTDLLRAVGA